MTDLTHEFIQLSIDPALDFATDTLKRLYADDAPHLATIKQVLTNLYEGGIQDLTRCIDGRRGGVR